MRGDIMKQLTRNLVSEWLPKRDHNTYKNKMGHVLCIGGNKNMGGAITLSAGAALYSGAGLVTVATDPNNLYALHGRYPEAMFVNMFDSKALNSHIQKADVIIIGPGLGRFEDSLSVFRNTIESVNENQWLIIDGDGLTLLMNEEISLPTAQVVLTPHLGEWKTLTGIEPPADNSDDNFDEIKRLQASLVLKKERTEIYIDDEIWENTAGNPSMATGGMGDTLTGIIGSFLGQFENKKEALLSAVYVHSAVADELAKTHYVTLPTQIIQHIPIFMKNL